MNIGINCGICTLENSSSGAVNLISNGTFDTNTDGWTETGGTISAISGKLNVLNGSFARAITSIATEIGEEYEISTDYEKIDSNGIIRVGTTSGGQDLINEVISITNTYTYTFTATTEITYVSLWLITSTSGDSANYDNVSVIKN